MPRASTAPRTIECPKCHQQLPQWAQQCQFCKTQLFPGAVRNINEATYAARNKPTWTEVAYIVVAAIVALQGVFMLLEAFNVIPNLWYEIGGGTFFGIFGSIQVALGVGMLCHQIWAQFLMKWICVLSILGGGFGFLRTLMTLGLREPDYVGMVVQLFSFCFFCFALYVINTEADV